MFRLPRLRLGTRKAWPSTVRYFTQSIHHRCPRQTHRAIEDAHQNVPRVPSFREAVARSNEQQSFADVLGRPSVKKQCVLFLGCSALIFSWAAWKTNEETYMWQRRLSEPGDQDSYPDLSSTDIRWAKDMELQMVLSRWYKKIDELPVLTRELSQLAAHVYASLANRYLNAKEGQRICYKITAINAAVWLFWKLPSMRLRMMTSFTHNPLSGLSYTLLTSMFSHKSFVHLLCNSLALISFGQTATIWATKSQADLSMTESTPSRHFIAFFVSAGLFSGLASHLASAYIRYPRMISQLNAARASSATAAAAVVTTKAKPSQATFEILPSLGASGAIYACMVVTALAFPGLHVALVIPPSFPIPIPYGVGGILLLDCIGVLRGWRFFDHFAHLGGALFGAGYYMIGPNMWHWLRVNLGRTRSEE